LARDKYRKLDFKSKDLVDITFLMKNTTWFHLEEVYLSNNTLSDIDKLSKFPNINFIDASNNYINDVTLHLPKLEKLYLNNNSLKKFPLLESGMNKLKVLNLNSNYI